MNVVVLMGRLTADPETRRGTDGKGVTTYTLAVDRRYKREGDPDADFLRCVAFGKGADFAEKYFRKGMRIAVNGHIQTGSYTNRDGNRVYTTDIIVDGQEFAQNKEKTAERQDFMQVPDDLEEQMFGR